MLQYTLIRAVQWMFNLVMLILLVRILISWIPEFKGRRFSQLLYQVTEPILAPIRTLLDRTPLHQTGMDFSVIAAILLLGLIENIVIALLVIL